MNFSTGRYDYATEMILSECPSGEVQKRSRRLDGLNYSDKQKALVRKKDLEGI